MHCLALILGIGIALLPVVTKPALAQAGAAAPSAASANTAGTWPTRPVRIIAPYAPGGVVDLLARDLGNSLGTRLGRSFIVENRPGA